MLSDQAPFKLAGIAALIGDRSGDRLRRLA